jgi:hypothetical protein
MAYLRASQSNVSADTGVESQDRLAGPMASVETASADSGNPMSPQPAGPTAFISYSRTDIVFVDRLQGALRARGVDARVDREDIEKGEE